MNWSAGAEILNRRSRLLVCLVSPIARLTTQTSPQCSYLTVAVMSSIMEPSVAWEMPWGMAAACCLGVCWAAWVLPPFRLPPFLPRVCGTAWTSPKTVRRATRAKRMVNILLRIPVHRI